MHAEIPGRRFFVNSAPHSAALFVFSFYGLQSFCVFHLRGPPGSCRRLFGPSWGPCGASACLLGVIGGLWAPLWDVSGLSGGLLRASWGPLGIPGCLLGVPGRPLAVSVGLWVPSGVLLGVSLGVSSGSRAPPGRVWALAGHLYAWIAAVAPAPPGTPPLSLSNSYHFGDFSAPAARGPDSVIWAACGNPPLSLSESYHFGDFSASAAPGPDSVIWPACVNPPLSLSESYHFGDFSASAARGPDSVIWHACVNTLLSLSESYHFGDFSASTAPGPDSVSWPACENPSFS